jgi:hypothetical protein
MIVSILSIMSRSLTLNKDDYILNLTVIFIVKNLKHNYLVMYNIHSL